MEEGELKKIINVCNDVFALTSHIVIKWNKFLSVKHNKHIF